MATITQATIYKGIIESKPTPNRRGTETHLDMTRWAIHDYNKETPTDSQIWASTRDKALQKGTRAFLWKALHNAFKIGRYWEHINNFKHRALCRQCDNVTETLKHILTECEASGQKPIWQFVKDIHARRGIPFEKPTLGEILGCSMIKRQPTGHKKGADRVSKIIVAEAAKTIWNLRCYWRITLGEDCKRIPSEAEAKNRMRRAAAKIIKLDCLTTDSTRFGRKATDMKVVLNTWRGILPESIDPLRTWRMSNEVLVGIG